MFKAGQHTVTNHAFGCQIFYTDHQIREDNSFHEILITCNFSASFFRSCCLWIASVEMNSSLIFCK